MRFTPLCCCTLLLANAGCARNPAPRTATPEQLTLYSLDPDSSYAREEKDREGKELFHGYLVLGKLDITDESERKAIMTALQDGIARSNGTMFKCFNPRHGIRAVENGRTIEYVICFECLQAEVHEGTSRRVVPTTKGPQERLNEMLTRAGVPLPPKNSD